MSIFTHRLSALSMGLGFSVGTTEFLHPSMLHLNSGLCPHRP